jgi:excisionase family DNA binding protein
VEETHREFSRPRQRCRGCRLIAQLTEDAVDGKAGLAALVVAVLRELGSADAGREVMSADQAADFLGLNRDTVYEYANRGQIPHQRLGKRLLFSRTALVAWLGQCKATSHRKGG